MQTTSRRLRPVALVLAVLMTGCESSFTYKLWTSDNFRHVRTQATNANVTVAYERARKDFVVSYDSVRDGGDATRRLNYFIGENAERVLNRKKPNFVSTNRLTLEPLSVNGNSTGATPSAAFSDALIIRTEQGEIGPYPLPVYVETRGTATQIVLTPLAATADLLCISAILALIGVYAYAGGCSGCQL